MKTQQTARRSLGRQSVIHPLVQMNKPTEEIQENSNPIQSNLTQYIDTQSNLTQYKKESSQTFTDVAQIRIDNHLFESIHNAVESAIFGGNYSIQSASHFIREALRDHANGVPLKVAHQNGLKKSLTIRLDDNLKYFWDNLPKRHRNNILERAIRTKLHSYQS